MQTSFLIRSCPLVLRLRVSIINSARCCFLFSAGSERAPLCVRHLLILTCSIIAIRAGGSTYTCTSTRRVPRSHHGRSAQLRRQLRANIFGADVLPRARPTVLAIPLPAGIDGAEAPRAQHVQPVLGVECLGGSAHRVRTVLGADYASSGDRKKPTSPISPAVSFTITGSADPIPYGPAVFVQP